MPASSVIQKIVSKRNTILHQGQRNIVYDLPWFNTQCAGLRCLTVQYHLSCYQPFGKPSLRCAIEIRLVSTGFILFHPCLKVANCWHQFNCVSNRKLPGYRRKTIQVSDRKIHSLFISALTMVYQTCNFTGSVTWDCRHRDRKQFCINAGKLKDFDFQKMKFWDSQIRGAENFLFFCYAFIYQLCIYCFQKYEIRTKGLECFHFSHDQHHILTTETCQEI